jgi:hypothetical protein
MHNLLNRSEAKELFAKNGLNELQSMSLLNLNAPCEWIGGKAHWRECKLLKVLADVELKPLESFAPLSADFLLSQGNCCGSGCKHCPY